MKANVIKWHWGPPASKCQIQEYQNKDRLSVVAYFYIQRKHQLGHTKPSNGPGVGHSCLRATSVGATCGSIDCGPIFCSIHAWREVANHRRSWIFNDKLTIYLSLVSANLLLFSALKRGWQSHRHGGFGGLSPPKQSCKPPLNWNMKHYKSVELCPILECQPPLHRRKAPPPFEDFLATVLGKTDENCASRSIKESLNRIRSFSHRLSL